MGAVSERLVNPADLRIANIFPGVEDHFRDWRDITVPEAPHYAFLNGDEVGYRLLMLTQFGRGQLVEKIERFKRLARHMKEGGYVPPVVAVQRADDSLLVKDGNHRAAVHCYLLAPQIRIELFPREALMGLVRQAVTAYPAMNEETMALRLQVVAYGERHRP